VQFRGELLVGVSDQGCRVWSVPAVPELATAILYDIPDAAGTFELYDREGNALLVVARADGTLAIHDLKTGARQRTIAVDDAEKPAAIRSLLSDPARGAVWAGLADGRIMGVDIEAGTMLESLALHKSAISALALSPQGDRLLSADEAGAIVCWDVASREPLAAFAHPALKRGDPALAVTAVVPLDDTRFVTASAQGDLRQWTIEGRWGEWKRLEGHAERVLALDFNPSGTLLAVGAGHTNRDGEVTIWETGKGMLVRRLANAHSDSVYGVRFSPDGTRLATASADKFVKVFDVSDGREWRSLEGHTNHVLSVDWSADGRQLVSGGADNVIKFWDPEAGESTRSSQPLDKQITNLRWPRGAGTPVVAAACGDRNVRFLNPGNTQVTRMFQGPQTFVYAVALSPDRTRVAAGDADGVLHIWNGNNAQVLHKIGPDR
jgi:WD40 repeat protein